MKMLKNILKTAIGGTFRTLRSANEMVEDVVDNIPVVGETFVDKVWSPATDLVFNIAEKPFELLGLKDK